MLGIDPRMLAQIIQASPGQAAQIGATLGYPASPQEDPYMQVDGVEGGKKSALPPWVQKGMTYGDWKKATPEPSASDQAWDKWYNTSQGINYMGRGMTFNVSPRARDNIGRLFSSVFGGKGKGAAA